MTAAKKCDRCGNYFSRDDLNSSEMQSVVTVVIDDKIKSIDGIGTKHNHYDFCPKCTKKFEEWFKLASLLSLCPNCKCMTKTLGFMCGQCAWDKRKKRDKE